MTSHLSGGRLPYDSLRSCRHTIKGPASGWTGGVNTLTSIPNGKPLTTPTQGPRFETHGPYQHGGGFPAVNGNAGPSMFDSNIPLTLGAMVPTGISQPNVFASEFGSSVYSSFESMSPTLDEKHWGIHAGEAGDDCLPLVFF